MAAAKLLLTCVAIATLLGLGAAQDPEITEVILPEIKAIGMNGYLNCTVINQLTNPVYWMQMQHVDTGKNLVISRNDKIELEQRNNEIENGLPKYQVTKIQRGDRITYRLSVNRLERRDNGTFRCSIEVIGSNTAVYKEGDILVLLPPSINKRDTSNTVTVEQGGGTILTCGANGYPAPNITWMRVNGRLLPGGKLRHQSSKLELRDVTSADRGVYRCLADNAVRPPDVFDVTLLIEFQPVARTIQSSYGQAEGRQFDVTLECRISGWPEPELKWYKLLKEGGKRHILNSDKETINILLNHANILEQQERWFQLIIRTVQANDFGDYICEGANTLGVSEAVVNLFATSECQGPNCNEEQKPEKNHSTRQVAVPVLTATAILVLIAKTISS